MTGYDWCQAGGWPRPPLRLLVVEPNDDDFRAIDGLLRACPAPYAIERARCYEDALAWMRNDEYDFCLISHDLGPHTGDDLLRRARRAGYDGACVMLGRSAEPECDFEAMDAGASAFLLRGELTPPLLERTIRYTLCAHQRLLELQELARRDPLTGLLNLRSFQERLEVAIERARRHDHAIAVLFMDLDAFKAVNDSYGHEIGSQLLIKLSRRLEQGLRRSDCVARIGGDEFAVVLEDVSDGNSALDTANKLITLIEETTRVGEAQVSVSASVGVALFPQDGEGPRRLMQSADTAMYAAKDRGGGNATRYAPDGGGVTGRWPRIPAAPGLVQHGGKANTPKTGR